MEVLEQMRMLLREKAILFGQYEQETLRLDTDDLDAVDDIVDAVQARQALIDKINGLDRRIAAIGEASAYGARCFHIGKNQCDYAGLTEAEQAVFRVGQEVFAIMTRIRELEDGIPGKMAVIQEQLQEKIKKNNVNGKFTGYLKQMGQGSKGVLYCLLYTSTDITGIQYEPWHYRYVGVEAAKYIKDNDLSLEEFYGALSIVGVGFVKIPPQFYEKGPFYV